MSIALVVLRGFSNSTVATAIKSVVTFGYTISTVIPPTPPTIPISKGLVGNQSTGNGIYGSQSLGSGLMSNHKINRSLTGSGKL